MSQLIAKLWCHTWFLVETSNDDSVCGIEKKWFKLQNLIKHAGVKKIIKRMWHWRIWDITFYLILLFVGYFITRFVTNKSKKLFTKKIDSIQLKSWKTSKYCRNHNQFSAVGQNISQFEPNNVIIPFCLIFLS